MDNKEAIAYQKRCRYTARMFGHVTRADDFAQWAVMKRLEGRTAKIAHLFVDYMREINGRTSNKSFKDAYQINFQYSALPEQRQIEVGGDSVTEDEDLLIKSKDHISCSTPSFEDDVIKSVDTERWMSLLTNNQRYLVELCQRGYSQAEICKIFNCSESRISQIVRLDIPRRIRLLSGD